MTRPILSILTPSIPSRADRAHSLSSDIRAKVAALGAEKLVEHLIFSDNWNRSIGEKRQNLVDLARGQYIAFLDDDDVVRDDYVERMLSLAETGADVLTFRQAVWFQNQNATVEFRLGHPDEAFQAGAIIKRGPWHVCGWKRQLVRGCVFPHVNYGEDYAWAVQARREVATEAHWPHVLHKYVHDEAVSEAPVPVG
jgi:glycosyltransferase involved in cell wall biosynthesis